MKALFIAGAAPATVFALAPLAQALRNAGHEVFMASTEDMMPTVARAGIPGVPVTDRSLESLVGTDRAGNPLSPPQGFDQEQEHTGRWFARLAAASLDALLALAADWRPDVVVGGTMSYAAPLLAAHLGIPQVRQTWDGMDVTGIDPHADTELAPELARLGLARLPGPDLLVDVCPPSLRPPSSAGAHPMRWIPGNEQRPLEPWMYTRGERRRVCVTAGSRVTLTNSEGFLRELAHDIGSLDVELVVAAPESIAAGLRETFPELRIGWVPLDVVAPTCDLIVHHGGGVTTITALNAGTPQLILPKPQVFLPGARRVTGAKAGRVLAAAEATGEAIAAACRDLLTDPGYREGARAIRREIASLPTPAEVTGVVERLVHLNSRAKEA